MRTRVVLEAPGLVDTPLVRQEFDSFGIDWDEIQKPEAFAQEVCEREFFI